jgi:hypothetical protein
MNELKDAVPDVVLRLDEAETALYIDGAILRRAKTHYNRRRPYGKRARCSSPQF